MDPQQMSREDRHRAVWVEAMDYAGWAEEASEHLLSIADSMDEGRLTPAEVAEVCRLQAIAIRRYAGIMLLAVTMICPLTEPGTTTSGEP